jgi:hypothetical protein
MSSSCFIADIVADVPFPEVRFPEVRFPSLATSLLSLLIIVAIRVIQQGKRSTRSKPKQSA